MNVIGAVVTLGALVVVVAATIVAIWEEGRS